MLRTRAHDRAWVTWAMAGTGLAGSGYPYDEVSARGRRARPSSGAIELMAAFLELDRGRVGGHRAGSDRWNHADAADRSLDHAAGVTPWPFLVQKFGGTSVADSDKILAAARRAIRRTQRGDQVLVVVSARGHTTDELIELAKEINERPPAREMDMLLSTGEQVSVALMAMAIQALGVPAISFTGAQIGIVTDSFHTKARIRNISTERMVQALDEGKIVIVAGFQGVDENYNITTLGRGGSDTTAVALAAVLGADACEIYTDVDGVYTTDPRIVPEARKIDRISYDEMLELASLGAGVMHSRSIEFAKKYGVPIHVRSSFSDARGDLDRRRGRRPAARACAVTGAALAKDEARITILGVPDRPGVVHAIFRAIAAANIVVDMIVQNVATEGTTEVSFTVAAGDLAETLGAAEAAAKAIGASGVTHDAEVAKVSVVGLGMRTHTGVATTMFEALAAGRHQHRDDHDQRDQDQRPGRSRPRPWPPCGPSTARSCSTQLNRRGSPVHRRIDRSATRRHEARRRWPNGRRRTRPSRPGAGMEDLVISGVELDESQARITLFDVPDRPGYAGRGLPRDRRGRRVRRHDRPERRAPPGTPHLSFTVPRDAAEPRRRGRRRGRARRGLGRAGDRQALGPRRRHADPHRRRHPDVRRPGRARHQHRPDQYQRGPDQRRHRHRPRPGRPRMPPQAFALPAKHASSITGTARRDRLAVQSLTSRKDRTRGTRQGGTGLQRRARHVGRRQVDQRDLRPRRDRLHLRPRPGAGHPGDPREGAAGPAPSRRSPRTCATCSSTTSPSPR